MAAKLTKKQALSYIKTLEGKGWDYDGAFGWQCFDLANMYWHKLFGHGLKGVGAADIPNWNNFNGEAKVYNNTPAFKAQAGDLVIFNRNYGGGYGHVAIVLNGNQDGKYMKLVSLDQNWGGGGLSKTEVARRVTHAYDFPMWFIRPIYKPEPKKATTNKETVKKESSKKKAEQSATKQDPKKKAKKLNYIRDEVKGYRLPNRGYKPKGIV